MTETALLSVEELSVSYGAGAKPVVDSVSLEILPGRCLGIIGESGAGKTQAFLAMMGLLPAQARVAGRARLEGHDLLGPAAAALRGRRVAMIFQDPMTSLTPHMRIGDQIAEPLVTHQGMSWTDARVRAATLLEQVRMDDVPRRLRQYPHELSGGMRQRAMIAMALACDPKLLIADEPTTALDVSVQAQILALLRQLVAMRGMTLAVVTHDMGVIAALADDVAVMNEGRIVERGPVTRILAAPEHAYTRALLAATPRVETPGAGIGRIDKPGAATNPLSIHNLRVDHRLRAGWLRRPLTLAAVDGVSLRIEAGEALGLVGESGCGKSTLSRALLRLSPVTAGEIVWLGQRDPGSGRRGAARRSFWHADRVPGSLRQPRSDHERGGHRRRAVAGAASGHGRRAARGARGGHPDERWPRAPNTRAAAAANFPADSVSAWQSRAPWSSSPNYWFATRRSARSTFRSRRSCWNCSRRIKRDHGTSILFVSHNLAVVRKLCERVLVMYLGRVVEEGPTEEVFLRPRHPYTRMLLESVPLLDPARERTRLASSRCRGKHPRRWIVRAGAHFHTRCPAALPMCA